MMDLPSCSEITWALHLTKLGLSLGAEMAMLSGQLVPAQPGSSWDS